MKNIHVLFNFVARDVPYNEDVQMELLGISIVIFVNNLRTHLDVLIVEREVHLGDSELCANIY